MSANVALSCITQKCLEFIIVISTVERSWRLSPKKLIYFSEIDTD